MHCIVFAFWLFGSLLILSTITFMSHILRTLKDEGCPNKRYSTVPIDLFAFVASSANSKGFLLRNGTGTHPQMVPGRHGVCLNRMENVEQKISQNGLAHIVLCTVYFFMNLWFYHILKHRKINIALGRSTNHVQYLTEKSYTWT